MDKKNTVPMLEKTLDILEYIGASETAVSLPELQTNLGIAQASCYRIAATLVQRGWLEKCSGNRYEIAAGVLPVAEKARFRLAKYRHLQPVLNRLADQMGFPAKFSVLDGDEFVNVCSGQCRAGQLSFSRPGFRSSLNKIASVSTIFLSEKTPAEQRRLLNEDQREEFQRQQQFYRKHGWCFVAGHPGADAELPFDTLSFPVRRDNGYLLGVISFLSLPGQLTTEQERIAMQIGKSLKNIVNAL